MSVRMDLADDRKALLVVRSHDFADDSDVGSRSRCDHRSLQRRGADEIFARESVASCYAAISKSGVAPRVDRRSNDKSRKGWEEKMSSPAKTTADQRRYLADRMGKAKENARKRLRDIGDPPEPANVKAARKTIKKWEEEVYEKSQKRSDELSERMNEKTFEMHERLNFGTPEEALAAVKEFEAWIKELKV